MINFFEWSRTLLEIFGGFTYSVPEDKEQQLYDFYMLNFIQGRSFLDPALTRKRKEGDPIGYVGKAPGPSFAPGGRYGGMTPDDEMDYMIEEVREKLLPALKKNLLDAVFFSVAAEIRHILDNVYENPREIYEKVKNSLRPEYAKILEDYLKNLELRKSKVTGQFMREPKRVTRGLGLTKPPSEHKEKQRRQSYFAALKATDSKSEFMKLAKFLYGNLDWKAMFGGKNWELIANGWLKLNEARRPHELFIWIDHVYDLQHNTGTVFNKVKTYAKQGGYEWLKKALDHKAKIKEPHEIIDKVSSRMRKLAYPAIKMKFGKSLQQFGEEKIVRKYKEIMNTGWFQKGAGPLLRKIAHLMADSKLREAHRGHILEAEQIFQAAKIAHELSNYQASQLRKLYEQELKILQILDSDPLRDISYMGQGELFALTKAQAEKLFHKVPNEMVVALSKLVPNDVYQEILGLLRKEQFIPAIRDLREKLGYNLMRTKNLVHFLIVAAKVYGELKPPVVDVAKEKDLDYIKDYFAGIWAKDPTLHDRLSGTHWLLTVPKQYLNPILAKIPEPVQAKLDKFIAPLKNTIVNTYLHNIGDRYLVVQEVEKLMKSTKHARTLIGYVIAKEKVKQKQAQAQAQAGQPITIHHNEWKVLKSVLGMARKPPGFAPTPEGKSTYLKNVMALSGYSLLRDKLDKFVAPAKEHILTSHQKPGSTVKTRNILNVTLDQAYDLEEYVMLMYGAGDLAA